MRLLLINDPGIPVPPVLYGGIERIVYQLANEYTAQGHEVTLLAGPGSYCNGKTIVFGRNVLQKSRWRRFKETLFVWGYISRYKNQYDAIHCFGRLIYLLPALNGKITKVMSYQREITASNIQKIERLPSKNMHFTGCSNYIIAKSKLPGDWRAIYNFVDFDQYVLSENVANDAPLVFLGRLDRIKGCHNCIKVAQQTGQKLVIAGNISDDAREQEYFRKEIEPNIDGDLVKYIGPVNDMEKAALLANAKCLLMLIEWDEPFGIVMIEAMACGTPVVAFRRGAVPEVVEDGVTGFIVNDIEAAISAISGRSKINRVGCRERAKIRFDVKSVAGEYLKLF